MQKKMGIDENQFTKKIKLLLVVQLKLKVRSQYKVILHRLIFLTLLHIVNRLFSSAREK